jgi:2-oxoglutarate dehydrogenase E1 component
MSVQETMERSVRSLTPVAQAKPSVTHNASLPRAETAYDISVGAQALADCYRLYGYSRAAINPLSGSPGDSSHVAELDPRTYGLTSDQSNGYLIRLGGVPRTLTLAELVSHLRASYCGSISLESGHVRALEQRRWLYAQMEARIDAPRPGSRESLRILAKLAATEAFEHFHRANFPNYKQFGLEGSESLTALLTTVIDNAARHGIEDIVLGMPHRGRLNMMLNALDVPAGLLLSLFSGRPEPSLAASDIKDHAGFSREMDTLHGRLRVLLVHNPSHLESVSPVVCGIARALQDRKSDGSIKKVMPVLIHGDASFCAQGVVTETLNLSQTRGYGVGGTLHLILNNQIGSTVSHPRDSRSTLYGADIARAVDAPILHVNADDPDAVVFAGTLATEFRMRFGSDIVVDHVGYRRHGHFMADDPTITQPAMQRRIRHHRGVVDIYGEQLARRGLVDDDELRRLKAGMLATLTDTPAEKGNPAPASAPAENDRSRSSESRRVRTAIPISQLRTIVQRLATTPPDFELHPSVEKMLENWRSVASADDGVVDWRLAENLAYGSLLANGYNVRLSGLDVGRGTFVHRQHVWHDQAADIDWQDLHVPLRHIAAAQGVFSIFESPLSEEAVVGFEYGYTLHCGRDLVVWEAQFGDFVNNAQVIIDQYVATGEPKWGYKSGLVLLLPHGYDGWGPEHSSAFLGRFLQLCADGNMRIAMPSTPSQSYHLLRRQALMDERRPLIVMTPKPWFHGCAQSYSRLHDLAHDEFHPLLRDETDIDRGAVVRAIVTSGKVYYDLDDERSKSGLQNLPLLRVEELYPFPVSALGEELLRFPDLREVVWAQEEAKNHGAWLCVRDQLEAALPQGVSLVYAGRPVAAPTAVCNAAQHAAERRDLVADALGARRT